MNIVTPPQHIWSEQNKIVNWIPMDTEELFNSNIKNPNTLKYLTSRGWEKPGCFTYNMNQYGFRGNFDFTGDTMIALGCSFTFGVGLPEEDLWCSLLANKLNLKLVNLGVGGCGMDTVFRLARYWLPIIRPKLVVLLVPPAGRFEIMDGHAGLVYNACNSEYGTREFSKILLAYSENAELNQQKNIFAVNHICDKLSIPFFHRDSSLLSLLAGYGNSRMGYQKRLARDMAHPGSEAHEQLADEMFNTIN
jgi:hypothetical protein